MIVDRLDERPAASALAQAAGTLDRMGAKINWPESSGRFTMAGSQPGLSAQARLGAQRNLAT